jgi:initiation factor 1A
MVKNKTGGSRHKKMARKNVKVPQAKARLRLAKEEGEIYAKVTKLNGNGMADVKCEDGKTRLLIIRRRFKGRNRRDNSIALDSLVLAGRRLWEVVAERKKQKVDLLYVYSTNQIHELRQKVNIDDSILPDSIEKNEEESAFEITSKHDWKNEQKLSTISEDTTNKKVSSSENTTVVIEGEEFDFDDI